MEVQPLVYASSVCWEIAALVASCRFCQHGLCTCPVLQPIKDITKGKRVSITYETSTIRQEISEFGQQIWGILEQLLNLD